MKEATAGCGPTAVEVEGRGSLAVEEEGWGSIDAEVEENQCSSTDFETSETSCIALAASCSHCCLTGRSVTEEGAIEFPVIKDICIQRTDAADFKATRDVNGS